MWNSNTLCILTKKSTWIVFLYKFHAPWGKFTSDYMFQEAVFQQNQNYLRRKCIIMIHTQQLAFCRFPHFAYEDFQYCSLFIFSRWTGWTKTSRHFGCPSNRVGRNVNVGQNFRLKIWFNCLLIKALSLSKNSLKDFDTNREFARHLESK